jgi:hypothetical protein
MFKSISWQEFIHASLWVIGIYYLLAIPVLYWRDIVQILKGRMETRAEEEPDAINGQENLMGDIKPSAKPNRQTTTAEDIVFSSSATNKSFEQEQADDIVSNRIIAELLDEIKILAQVHASSKATKEEVLSVLTDLLSNYSQASSSERDLINNHIRDQYLGQCSIELFKQEVESCWSSSEGNQ